MAVQFPVMSESPPSPDDDQASNTKSRRRVSTRSRRNGALGLAIGLAMVVIGACASTDTISLIDMTNNVRWQNGRQLLGANWPLIIKAQAQAQSMAGRGQLFHSYLPADNPYQWRALGENVAMVPTAGGTQMAHNTFMSSGPHLANILDQRFNYMGAASFDDGRGTLWVVEEFMQL